MVGWLFHSETSGEVVVTGEAEISSGDWQCVIVLNLVREKLFV